MLGGGPKIKYAVYTKRHWPTGILSAEELQTHMGEKVKGSTIAEDVIWWKIDENHHQSVIIYPSEESAKAELEQRVAKRANDSEESGIILLEEHMGPVMSQLSMLKLAY